MRPTNDTDVEQHEPRHDELRYASGYPNIEDITRRLRFDAGSGSVWLHDRRVVIFHADIFSEFRASLIEASGVEGARKLITTLGYKTGVADAQLAKKLRSSIDLQSMIAAGPQLAGLMGLCLVDPLSFTVDIDEGRVLVEAMLVNDLEADFHIKHFGIGSTPACWFSAGHASGFFSWCLGKPVLFREIECRALGNSRCRIIGMPLYEHRDAAQYAKYFNVPEFIHYKSLQKSEKSRSRPIWHSFEKPVPADPMISKEMVGTSPGFKVALEMMKLVARTDATVLFTGHSGVGKEIFSRTLHNTSHRRDKPFVAVNCAAIPDTLIESELFGVERGAYTGASASRPGRFERAHTGTLFLDEVASLSPPAQGKMLRVLQEGELERLGGTETRSVDVRIVAATNVDLRVEVANGRFREDLFYRLNVFPINIPPLRSRRDDIPLLVNNFFTKFSELHKKSPAGFTQEALEALLSYDWPGNIRELENMLERAVILAPEGGLIQAHHIFTSGEHLSAAVLSVDGKGTLSNMPRSELDWTVLADKIFQLDEKTPIESCERALVQHAIERAKGNVSSAARMLGLTRGQLDYRLKKDNSA